LRTGIQRKNHQADHGKADGGGAGNEELRQALDAECEITPGLDATPELRHEFDSRLGIRMRVAVLSQKRGYFIAESVHIPFSTSSTIHPSRKPSTPWRGKHRKPSPRAGVL